MSLKLFSSALFAALLCKNGCCQPSTSSHDFDSDLTSWARLKREAGYFTSSYDYKGGLYKRARDTEFESYYCTQQDRNKCIEWTVTEKSVADVETGDCQCKETDLPYCEAWNCTQREGLAAVRCAADSDCPEETTECSCDTASRNGRYCRKWSCTERDPDGSLEYEEYTCMREDDSRHFCARWSGDIDSDDEVESAVCECEESEERHCSRWMCKERGLIKCSAFGSGWCRISYAIGIGGVLGLVAIICGLVLVTRNPDSREKWLIFIAVVAVFCLPWMAGVAIWGGVEAVGWVALMWGVALLVSVLLLCNTTRRLVFN